MALATKCPHCNTVFRVALDQLKLRGGIVRCGACNEVFDGNAALVEPVAKPVPVMPSVPVVPAPVPEPAHHIDTLADERHQVELPTAFSPLPDAGDIPADAVEHADAPAMAGDDTADASDDGIYSDDHASADEHIALDGLARDAEAAATDEAPPDAHAGDAPSGEAQPLTGETAESTLPAEDADTDSEAAGAHDAPDAGAEPESSTEGEEPADAEASSADTGSDAPASPPAATAAAELDFIVDPDEFTDPLAVQEPKQDTAQEHLVAASLDDAHHFDDLPPADAGPETVPEESTPAEPESDDAAADDAAPSDEQAAALASETASGADSAPETAEDESAANRSADEAAAADLLGAAPESATLAATGSAAVLTESSDDEPGFVKRANRRQRFARISKAVMAFGSPILLAALVAQGVTTFRNPLAASFPSLKPTLNAMCQPLGCKVELPMQIDMLAIEQGELQTLADNTFSFATVLRNQARTAQSWPSIELTLNDASDKPLVRRVFTPRDYLASQAEVDKGFAPRSEQPVKLYFELSQAKASGYHIAIFYP